MIADEKLRLNRWDYDNNDDFREAVKNHPWRWVAGIDWENRKYSFAETRIYQDKRTGLLYLAFDKGCSCPKAFENHTVADLIPLRSIADWYKHALEHRTTDRKSVV